MASGAAARTGKDGGVGSPFRANEKGAPAGVGWGGLVEPSWWLIYISLM
ncbi:hypothetical protein ES708_17033 [subsurface metagenome]